MSTLDRFYDGIVTQDNRLRTTTYSQLVDFLQDPRSSCTSENISKLIDGLGGWVNSSNFKVLSIFPITAGGLVSRAVSVVFSAANIQIVHFT